MTENKSVKTSTDIEKVEFEFSTRLPPLLFTAAVFSLSILRNVGNNTAVDELLAIFAALCLISAALIVDSLLDKIGLTFNDRFFLLHGGYLLFSLAISAAIPLLIVLYLHNSGYSGIPEKLDTTTYITIILFGATSIAIFWKMMTLDPRNISFMSLLALSTASSIWLYYLGALHPQ